MTSVKCSWWCSSRFTGQERSAPFFTRQKRMLSQPQDTILNIINSLPLFEDHYPHPFASPLPPSSITKIAAIFNYIYIIYCMLGTLPLDSWKEKCFIVHSNYIKYSKQTKEANLAKIPAVIKSSHPHPFNADISVSPGQHTHLARVSDSRRVPHHHQTLAMSILTNSTQHTTRVRKTICKEKFRQSVATVYTQRIQISKI